MRYGARRLPRSGSTGRPGSGRSSRWCSRRCVATGGIDEHRACRSRARSRPAGPRPARTLAAARCAGCASSRSERAVSAAAAGARSRASRTRRPARGRRSRRRGRGARRVRERESQLVLAPPPQLTGHVERVGVPVRPPAPPTPTSVAVDRQRDRLDRRAREPERPAAEAHQQVARRPPRAPPAWPAGAAAHTYVSPSGRRSKLDQPARSASAPEAGSKFRKRVAGGAGRQAAPRDSPSARNA